MADSSTLATMASSVVTAMKSVFIKKSDKVSSWSSTTSNDKVPSEKLVKDSLDSLEGNLSSVATSGSYTDLTDKPDIPAASTDLSDSSNLVRKSGTTGLIKNDGTIDTSVYLTTHQDISGKADKNGGVAQVTDANSANYTNIGTLSSGSTQQAINNAINTSLGGKSSSNHVHGGISNDGKIGTDSGKVIVTTTNGELTASDWVSEADAITLALIAYGESL